MKVLEDHTSTDLPLPFMRHRDELSTLATFLKGKGGMCLDLGAIC